METTIKVHGVTLRLVGHEFGPNEYDFNKVCDIIELAATQLDRGAIEAAIWDSETDDYRNRDDDRLQTLIDAFCVAGLKAFGWDKPDVPYITVYGQP